MKKTILTLLITLSCSTLMAQGITNDDELAVEKVVLNYIENFFENNYSKMETSIHKRLAKRGLNPDGSLSTDFPPEELKKMMLYKEKFPLKYQKNTVEEISIFGNMASAQLTTGYPDLRWVEYIHLAKLDGKWKMINVFWEYQKPTQ